jgi:hypothetical protein
MLRLFISVMARLCRFAITDDGTLTGYPKSISVMRRKFMF